MHLNPCLQVRKQKNFFLACIVSFIMNINNVNKGFHLYFLLVTEFSMYFTVKQGFFYKCLSWWSFLRWLQKIFHMSSSKYCWYYLGENPKYFEADDGVFNMLTDC